jgi:pimeloyl-ACP methyl ester carboxylesterase
MATQLLCLHGFTQNGAQLRSRIAPLARRLGADVELVCPDGPHACSQATVDRLYTAWNLERQPPPYLCWWDASDDGRIYRGWETTLDRLKALCQPDAKCIVLGFSQGALVAAALAALSSSDAFPALAGAVLVAGRAPRSDALKPLFDAPIRVPSLHVWGERDEMSKAASAELVEHFDASTRQVALWPGPHAVPLRGSAADAIVQFVTDIGSKDAT